MPFTYLMVDIINTAMANLYDLLGIDFFYGKFILHRKSQFVLLKNKIYNK